MNFFKHVSKRTKVIASVLLLTLIAVPAITMASFGPDRPTKAYFDGVPGFDHVTFNSFTGVPGIGDERNFFNGKYEGSNVITDPLAEVKDGETVTLQVYVHNNADATLNDTAGQPGVARNTKVRVALPSTIAPTQQATAYISADNAQPKQVTDTLDFGAKGGANFQLEYVNGSAHITGNNINTQLPDSVVTTGATIGSEALNGNEKACFKEVTYVTIQVKVKMPEYKIAKEVRMAGQTSNDWTENKVVNPGATVQWLVTFTNNGKTPLTNVKIVDQVPAGLTVVPGTVKLINGNYPNGFVYPASAIQGNGRTINVDIGNYNPDAGGVAYVMYDTKVDALPQNVCTDQNEVNKAFATPAGLGAIFDTASVTVKSTNDCTPPKTPQFSCDVLTATRGDNRSVSAKVTKFTAANGATLKTITYDFGDKTTPFATNDFVTPATHTYVADGTYKVSASLRFSVNGQDKVVANAAGCMQTVSFTTPVTPVTPVASVTPPTVLPNTGAGNVIGMFAGAVLAGAIGYRVYLSRKFAR